MVSQQWGALGWVDKGLISLGMGNKGQLGLAPAVWL